MLTQSNNEQTLKTQINHTKISSTNLYYTLCKKQANTISLLSNWRILVFDETQGNIYYVNQPNKIPFNPQQILSKPKKDVVFINVSTVRCEPKSKVLIITFNKKSQKEIVLGEWKFTMESQELTEKWVSFIKKTKETRTANKLGIQQKEVANSINDVFDYGLFANRQIKNDQSELDEDTKNMKEFLLNPNISNNINKNSESFSKNRGIAGSRGQTNKIEDSKTYEIAGNILNQSFNFGESKQIGARNSLNLGRVDDSRANESFNRTSPPKKVQTYNKNSEDRNLPISANKPEVTSTKYGLRSQQKNNPNNNLRQSAANNSLNLNLSRGQRIDWNKIFLQDRSQTIVYKFSQSALETFISLQPENIRLREVSQGQDAGTKKIEKNGFIFLMAEHGSKLAKKLKKQFNNYHYILECFHNNLSINVPLCCIIQYLGIVCLAKAKLPSSAQQIQNINNSSPSNSQINQNLRLLEQRTKISSESIKKFGTFFNVSQQYGTINNLQAIFIDHLSEFLPDHPESLSLDEFCVRSELIQHHFSKVISSRGTQTKDEISEFLSRSLLNLSDDLSQHKVLFANYSDLKMIMHKYGLNTHSFPKMYLSTKSKLIKKYIHTAMLSRIIKGDLLRTIVQYRESGQTQQIPEMITELLRQYCEKTQKKNEEVWKNIAQQFKKKYRCIFNLYEVQSGFLLSSLMSMISALYNPSVLDKDRKFFEEDGIINDGFVTKLKPKLKTYHKFASLTTHAVMKLCQKGVNNMKQINEIIPLHSYHQLYLSKSKLHAFLLYVSPYVFQSPSEYPDLLQKLLGLVNREPVSSMTHQITLSYASLCLKHDKIQQYKKCIELAMDLLTFWVEEDHPFLSDIFQSLSNYYSQKGSSQDSLNFMKQALTTCIRSIGTHTQRAGIQYFKLAEKQLQFGDKEQAIQNYYKCKLILQGVSEECPEYTHLLLRVANLELSQGDLEKSISFAVKAIKSSQGKRIPDQICIKIYDILCRAYELNQNKDQMINLAHLAAKMFNRSSNMSTFDQMIRICLIGFLLPLELAKLEKLELLISWMSKKRQVSLNREDCLDELMMISHSNVVMEKFESALLGIDKILAEAKGSRSLSPQFKQTKKILQLIFGAVGQSFIQGAISQAKIW